MMQLNADSRLTQGAVTLTLLQPEQREALKTLADDPRIWEVQPSIYQHFEAQWFNKALEQFQQQKRWPFAIQYHSQWAGSSSFYEVDEQHKRLTIGYTWYAPQFWGTSLNPTVKLLMLQYAFETLKMQRVAFTVDAINTRSCGAMEKLGAKREGVLRKHMLRPDGSSRDTVVFAIVDEEWPVVKAALLKRLAFDTCRC